MKQRINFNKSIVSKGIILFFTTLFCLHAQTSVEKLFEEGNNSYNEGDYKKAVALYQETLMLDQHSAALYFNLGNAFYRLNKVAESIYYFEKAKQLLPNDEDILVNSSFAQNMTIDAIEILPESQLEQFKNRIFNSFIFSTWTIITIVLIWLFALLFLFYIFSKSTRFKRTFFLSSLFILIFFMVSFVISFSLDQKEKQIDYAILFSNRIEVWSEPNQLGELLFSLHEGTKFQILDDLAEWQKIRIANGSEGWVKNAYLRKLN